MPDYVRNAYGTNAEPPQTICPHLMADLKAFLSRHNHTPDEIIINRILFKHGISDEPDMCRAYGETPFQKFLKEYRTEVFKAI
jgi:hypothetical protein